MTPRQITLVRRRPARAVVHRQAFPQTIEGSEQAVRARLIELLRAGELVEAGRFRKVGSRWVVQVVAFPPAAPVRRPLPTRRIAWIASGAVAVLAAVTVTAVLVVTWLVAHVAQLAVGGVLVLLAWFAVTRLNHSGACAGLHCSGCKGGH